MVTMDSSSGAAVVLRVAGDVDVTDVVALRNAIASALEDERALQIVVDVSLAHRLGPRGLALLVDEKAMLMRRGGDLHLVRSTSAQLAADRDDGLSRLFHIHASVEEAIAKLA